METFIKIINQYKKTHTENTYRRVKFFMQTEQVEHRASTLVIHVTWTT